MNVVRKTALGVLVPLALILALLLGFILSALAPSAVTWTGALICPADTNLRQLTSATHVDGQLDDPSDPHGVHSGSGVSVDWACEDASGRSLGSPIVTPGTVVGGLLLVTLCFLAWFLARKIGNAVYPK